MGFPRFHTSIRLRILASVAFFKVCLLIAGCSLDTTGTTCYRVSTCPPACYDTEPIAFNTEEYDRIYENPFLETKRNPLSTFSIDVDTASYANCRRYLHDNLLPPKDAVRIEEFINYFQYEYPAPTSNEPLSITSEVSDCPWNPDHELLLVGLQGQIMEATDLPPSNLVFLLDVSGSMHSPDKLPLLKSAMHLLIDKLRPEDRIAIVAYAGAAGLVLDSTSGADKDTICQALDSLQAGGSTAGGEGIELAYKIAMEHYIANGNNRVILATDGDFNVGVSDTASLVRLIEKKRESGVFLTMLGFGTGNLKDSRMENLADKGNGNYAYIDSILEAKKALVQEFGGTLMTIAKDVKLQIEFNPAYVGAYRLIGYENRMLRSEDFNNDRKDAGELGAGHQVTALYEIIKAGKTDKSNSVDDLKYQNTTPVASHDMFTLKLRYKLPDQDTSRKLERVFTHSELATAQPSNNLSFASAVAEFGMLLRDSEYKGTATYSSALSQAQQAKGEDPHGYRAELVKLIEIASHMKRDS